MKTGYVICNSDIPKFVVISDMDVAKAKMDQLSREDYKKNWNEYDISYKEYQNHNYWRIYPVGALTI